MIVGSPLSPPSTFNQVLQIDSSHPSNDREGTIVSPNCTLPFQGTPPHPTSSPNMDLDEQSPTSFLETLLTQTPSSLHPHIEQLITYAERKLYHQLSNALHALLRQPESAPYQIQLWNGFISKLAKRLDQLRAVEMAVIVAQQYEGESSWVGEGRGWPLRVVDLGGSESLRMVIRAE